MKKYLTYSGNNIISARLPDGAEVFYAPEKMPGIEKRDEPTQPSHETLFKHGIPLIEHLAHLEQLTKTRFFVVAVPWRVHGLEASPVSVVAFEPYK